MNSLKDYMKNVNSQPQADSSASKAATSGPAAPKVVPTTTDIAGKVRAAASGQKITTPQTQTSAPAADQTAAGSAASSGMSSLKDYMAKKTGRNTGSTSATQPASAGIPRMKTIWSDPKARQTVLGNMGKDFEGYDGSWGSAKSFLPGMEKGLGLQSSMIDTWQKEAEDLSRSLTAQYRQLEQMQADPMTSKNPYAAKRYSDAIDRYNKELEEYRQYVADIETAATMYGTHYQKYKEAGDVYAGGQKSLPKSQQIIDSILGADRTQVTGEKTDWGKLLWGNVVQGANSINAKLWQGVNMLRKPVEKLLGGFADEINALGTETINGIIGGLNSIPGVNIDYIKGNKSFMEWAYEDAQKGFQQSQEKYSANANSSRAAQIINSFGVSTVAAIPMALEAYLLKPYYAAKAAVGVGTKGLEYFSALQNSSGLQAASTMAKEGMRKLFSNPQFWTSYLQTIGEGYEDALKDGMSETDATIYGTVNGFFNALIEVGGADETLGGIQNLPMRLDQMKEEAGKKKLVEWFKDSVLGEGLEEIQQGAFERGMKAAATPDNGFQGWRQKWLSVDPTDKEAVFNPWTAIQEFTGGAVVGGLLGAGQTGVSNIQNARYDAAVQRAQEELEKRQAERTKTPEADKPTQQQFYNFLMENGSEDFYARNKEYAFLLYQTDEGDSWIGQIYQLNEDGTPRKAVYETAEYTKETAAQKLAAQSANLELTQQSGTAEATGTAAAAEPERSSTARTLDTAPAAAVESEPEVKGLSLPPVETETPARTTTPASGTAPQPSTEGGITNGEPEQFRPAAAGPLPAAGTAATAEPAGTAEPAAAAGSTPADGDGGRVYGGSAGEQSGRLAEGTGRVQKNRQVYQAATGSKRRSNAQNSGEAVRLSAQDLGIQKGSSRKSMTVYQEEYWDDELRAIDADTFSKTGQHTVFVVGAIEYYTSDGKLHSARGAFLPDGREVVQVDHTSVTATQIHEHEDWHRMEAEDPGLHSAAVNALIDSIGEEAFNKIYDKYVEKLWGTKNLPEHYTHSDVENICREIEEEMLADMHGGINFAGIGADRYKSIVDAVIADRSPTRQTAAATASTTGPPKFSFAGQRARTMDNDALLSALGMKLEGEDMETVRKSTGWFKGMDGSWKFEISDDGMTFRTNPRNLPSTALLGDIIDHEELFAAYPDMRNMLVEFVPMPDGTYGEYRVSRNSIALNENLKYQEQQLADTMIHEIQHAIQSREGFAGGASEGYWQSRIDRGYDSRRPSERQRFIEASLRYNKLATEYPMLSRNLIKLLEEQPEVPRGEVDWDTLEQLTPDPPEWEAWDARREALEEEYGEVFWQMLSAIEKREKANRAEGRDAYQLYRDTAGEVEARNASDRRMLQDDSRRSLKPVYDYPDAVFTRDNAAAFSADEEDLQLRPITEEQNGGIPEDVARAYLEDVTDPRGGSGRAGDIFDQYVLRTAGSDITPFIYTSNYNHNSPVAKAVKTKDPFAIAIAAEEMQAYVPHDAVLIPMPGHNGRADDTMTLANAVAALYNEHHPDSQVRVLDALAGNERESQYITKKTKHRSLTLEEMGMHTIADIPADRFPVFIDNVVASGQTATAAQKAVGRGMTLAFAYGNRTTPVPGLKLASPITYDDSGRPIPITERFNRGSSDIRYSADEENDYPQGLSLPAVQEEKTAADIDDVYIRAVEEGNEGTARRMTNEAARAAGYNIHAFHGTKRGDRVGNKFLPERSTSGPMAFFTDNRQIAENYARDKNDTSLAYDEEYSDYYQQFRVTRNGKSIPVSDLWRSMTPAEKRTMTERAKHITFDDDYENIIYDRNAKYGLGNMDPYTINSHNGNVIDALIENWLVDGNIYREEGRFLEVLKLAGIDNVEYRDPDAKHEKVYDTYLKINNPFNTVEDVNEDFARGLEEWYAQQDPARYKKESAGADLWDKNNWTAEHWIEKLRENIADGTTTAWTSIPDFVTDYLKYLGYDGIQDVGGKGGGEGHTVWIPFSGEQVKTVDAATYDDSGNIIPISQRFNQNINDIRYSSDEEEADYPEGLSLPVPEKERQKAPADSRKLITKLRDSIPELENMETLATFTGSEFRKGDQNLVDQVGKFFASLGNSVYRDGFGPIIMDENSVKADIAHGIGRIKAASFSVVPAVLRSGKEIDFQENWEGRGRDSHIFAGPVKMGDNKVYIAAVVMRGRDNRFYVHEAVDENGNLIYSAKKSPADIQTEVTAQGGIIGSAEDSDNSLAEPKRPVKTDFSTDDQTPAERRRAAEERKERRREAEERERLAAAGASPDVQPKTETPKATPKESKPVLAKKNLRNQMFAAFSIPEGRRAEIGAIIDSYADRLFRHGEITQSDRDALLDRLYSEGVMTVKHDDSGLEEHPRIYISPEVRAEFGEDWNEFRRRAFANGIYFTNNKADRGADSWQQTLAGKYAGIYDENTDMRSFLESLVQIAQDSKDEHMTLDEYNAYIARQEGVDEDLLRDREMTNLERQLDNALRNFAEQANLEVYYRSREDRIRQDERRKAYEGSKEYAARQAAKEAKEKERRNQMAQQNRENRELREMQQRTLKQLQWLSKNRYRMPEQLAETAKEILSDLDIYAAGAARATNYSKRYEATWEDIAKIYKEARATDPNFFPSQDLERIVARLDNAKIADLDPAALADLYKAAVGLRTEFYNKQNLINDQNHAMFQDVYDDTREEMARAPKDGKDNEIIKSLNLEMMTPANVLQMLFGWDKNSTGNRIAQQLVDGERAMKAYEVGAKAILDDFIEEHQDWIKKADGQGKDAIWYEIEVPELLELRMGDKPIFGKTVKVYMTPAQKVQLAIESKSKDNLRHMLGGRTFVNKDLYSKGKRAEAFAQGTTIKLAPETVEYIVKDLTPEERELADILGNKYYNDYSGKKIDEVSVPLYGYKKTMGGWYAPIFTNQNYTNNEAGLFDVTAEGVGNLKQRQVSKNPSYNISAFDAFERNINMTKRFVGMAIPARNWQTLMNWQGDGTSFKDELTHMWGNEYKEYIQNLITRLQAGGSQGLKEAKLEKATNKLLGNYITSVFGANPGIVFKQAASFPQFAAVMGWDTMPAIGQLRGVNTDLMRTYTPELAYRMLGYSTPETATLKENPSRLDTNPVTKFFLRGGAITWMDGATVQRAWPWAENYVRKNFPDLEVGSEQDISEGRSPFYKKVAEVFNEAVGTTQPMYDEMHRPNIMKDSRGVQRAFTMFKTVPLQQYNTMRRAAGEAAAAKEEFRKAQTSSNEIRKQEAEANYKDASKRMANAVTATIASVMLFNLIGFVDQLWRNRGKKYRDDEGNLTWNSVAQGLFSDSIDSVTGMVIYGQELTDLITNLVTGEKWYGIEIPGGEQLDEIIDQISTAADTIRKVITDVADITAGGGDPTEYWRRHAGDFAGAIKDVAFTFSKYYNGLSAENVEKYIMGTLMTISPQTYTMLQDYFETPAKYNLKGLSGEQFTQRAGDLFGSRNINVTDSMLRQLEQMYNDGYTDVIPSETAGTVTVNGNKYSLGANAQQIYDNTFAEYVNSGLEEILAGGLNEREASKAVQTLYNYAAAKAKEAAAADQLSEADARALKKSTAAVDEVMEHGVTLPEWSLWKGITSEKFPDEDEEGEERSANTVEKLGMLRDFDVSDETKKALYGYLRGGYEMETEAGNPTNYAKMLDLTSRNMTIDEFIDWSIAYAGADKETDKLEALRDFNASEAAKQDLFGFIKGGREMETETGSPTQYAKMIAATKAGLTTDEYCDWLINTADMKKDNEKLDYLAGTDFSDKEKLALIGNLMGTDMQTASGNPTQYAKIKTLNDSGISIDDCIDLKLTDALDRYYNAQTKNKVASGDSGMTGLIITIEDELDKLQPANGDTQVDDFQKFEVIYRYGKQKGLSNEKMLEICKVYASYDSYIPKLELSMKHNVGIDTYCRARTAMRQESMANDNNITITTKEAAAALTKMVERGQITKEEAAVLYQLQQKNWGYKNNPFSREIGKQVYEELNSSGTTSSGSSSTSGSGTTSGSAPGTASQGLSGLKLPSLPGVAGGTQSSSQQQAQQSANTGTEYPAGLSLPSPYGDRDRNGSTSGTGIPPLPEQQEQLRGLSLPTIGH